VFNGYDIDKQVLEKLTAVNALLKLHARVGAGSAGNVSFKLYQGLRYNPNTPE
jgi:hypothetical protein